MHELTVQENKINSMSAQEIEKVCELERAILALPQVDLPTQQTLHAGMYARTMFVKAGVTVTGSLMKCATILIISGRMQVYVGNNSIEFEGYHIIPAAAGRKQAGYAIEDTHVTMLFPTKAKTIEEAEEEFTDEVDKLISRNGGSNDIVVTGQ